MFLFSASGCQNYLDSQQDPNITSQVQKRACLHAEVAFRHAGMCKPLFKTPDGGCAERFVCRLPPLPPTGVRRSFYFL